MKKISSLAIAAVITITASSSALSAPWNYTKTKYPIVLVHGVSGFNTLGGVINYFHNIPYNLKRSGATVHVPSVSSFNSSEVRGQQLADYLVNLGGTKYNVMGHSQGAPTSRVAASLVPHKIASVTSINGVNLGSDVADSILGVIPPGASRNIVGRVADSAGEIINLFSGSNDPQNAIDAAISLSREGTTRLNNALAWKGVSSNCSSVSENVDISGHNIKMFSWGGNKAFTNFFDASDLLLSVTSLAFAGRANDGLVDTCSQKLGNVINVNYNMNHLDAVNHVFGARGFTNPVSLYRSHANRLKNKGL